MNLHIFVIVLSFLVCLIAAAALFSTLIKISFLRENLLVASFSFGGSALLCIPVIVFLTWYSQDFVSDMTFIQYSTGLLCLIPIALSFFIRLPFATEIATLISSAITVTLGNFEILFLPQQASWLNIALTIIILFGFAYGWRALCGLNPFPQIESIAISGGLLLLFLLGFAPFILGVSASGILGISIIAYLYSAHIPLSSISSPLVGFIFGWLGLVCYQEYLLPCFLIFTMFYLLEFLVAFLRKATLLPQYKELCYNTIAVQSFSSGFPSIAILRTLWSSNILLIIFGILEIHSENTLSLIFISCIISIWQLYRMINWQQSSKTLKQTNKQLFQDVKNSLHSIFTSVKNNSKDKK